jgi:hypothetical protein
MRRLVRTLLTTLLTLPMALGWAIPVGAGPITATVCLRDSQGVGISGAEAFVNSGSYLSLGFTDATGCVSTDLASALGNRTFRISYRGQTQNKTQNTSTNPNVSFQTVAVNVRLLDSTGAGIAGAGIEFNNGTWQSLGTTDPSGTVTTELLGINTNFRVTHRGLRVNKSQNTSTNPNVSFQTVAVNVRLLDSTGAGIAGAGIEFNGGTWQSLGTTDPSGTVTTELLGLNTTFRLTRTGQSQSKSQNTSTNPDVIYQTGRVLQGTGPRVLAWSASGWHPFSNGVELLPGNVTFDFNTGPNQAHAIVAGTTTYVPVAPTAPVVTAGDQVSNEGQPVVLDSVSFVDQEAVQTHRAIIDWGDGSPATTGVVGQANGLAGTVDGGHVFADDGTYTVEVCVSDDGNPDAEGCGTLQVTVANLAPQATILGASGSGEEGTELTLSSSVSDVDPVNLSWVVSLDGRPMTTGTGPDLVFTPIDDGVYDVELTADDGDGGLTTVAVQLAVDNLAPFAAITGAPDSATTGEVVTLSSSADDPGATDVLTYGWAVSGPGGAVSSGSGSDFSFIPDAAGSYQVTLVVGDGDGASTTAQLLIEIAAAPAPASEPPPASEPGPQTQPGPEPETQFAPEPPGPEVPAPAPNNEVNHELTPATLQAASETPGHESDPAQADTATQPALEPEASVTAPSEPVAEEVVPAPVNDRVMYLALIADRSMGPSSDVPSTGLILVLLWLGPALVILARTRLRQQAE